MLELIVLGQIPGSHIQLSFGGVMLLWAAFLALMFAVTRGRKYASMCITELSMLRIYLSLRLRQRSPFARWQNALAVKLKLF